MPRIERSSSADIAQSWEHELRPDGFWERWLRDGARPRINRLPGRLLDHVATAPGGLQGRAFLLRNVVGELPAPLDGRWRTGAARLISRAYLLSYLAELDARLLCDTRVGRLDCDMLRDDSQWTVSARALSSAAEAVGLERFVSHGATPTQLLELRDHPVWPWLCDLLTSAACAPGGLMHRLVRRRRLRLEPLTGRVARSTWTAHLWKVHQALGEDPVGQLSMPLAGGSHRPRRDLQWSPVGTSRDDRAVFLVHGRNERLVAGVRVLLEKAGLVALSWTRARELTGSGTPHTIDVVRAGMEHAQAVLVLMSDDERVQLRDEMRSTRSNDIAEGYQARPNVLVEAGMALAVDGRRTVLAAVGDLRPITDLDGMNYIGLNETAASRRALVSALKDAGCDPANDAYHEMTELDFLGEGGPTPCRPN